LPQSPGCVFYPDGPGAIVCAEPRVLRAPEELGVINCATAGPGPSELGTIGPFEPEAASRRCPEHHLAPANRFEDGVHRTLTLALLELEFDRAIV
jgi:hypothetical protein